MFLTKKSRLGFAAVAASLALIATGCSSNTTAEEPPAETQGADTSAEVDNVRLTVFPSLNSLGAYSAVEEGLFEEAGLNVEVTPGSNAAATIPQMIGGSVDIVLMDMVTPIVASTQEVPLVMIAPAGVTKEAQDGKGFVNIMVKDDSDITEPADLEGASVGIIQINSQPWMDTRAVIDDAGADSSTVEFVEVPNLGTALAQDQVDAIVMPEPVGTTLAEEAGHRFIGALATEEQIGAPEYAYVTTKEFAEANPETIEAFQNAMIEANKKINADDDYAVQIGLTYIDAPEAVLQSAVKPAMGEEPLSADALKLSTERMERYGLLTSDEAATVAETILLSAE